MSFLQIRWSHKWLYRCRKPKLLAVVLSGHEFNEEPSWDSHVKIIKVWAAKAKKKTIAIPISLRASDRFI